MMDKKIARKVRRKEALLLKREPGLGQFITASCTAHVLVGNGGVANGISQALLREILATAHVYTPPGKDYAFASFPSVAEAEEKLNTLNGACVQAIASAAHLPPGLASGPPLHLYLSYVAEIPELATDPLFPTSSSSLPLGLVLVQDFITAAMEERLVAFFDFAHASHAHLKHRQVIHYGYQFNYDTNNVDIGAPLPGGFPLPIQQLVSKLVSSGHVHSTPDQVTVNCYHPGAGIDHSFVAQAKKWQVKIMMSCFA